MLIKSSTVPLWLSVTDPVKPYTWTASWTSGTGAPDTTGGFWSNPTQTSTGDAAVNQCDIAVEGAAPLPSAYPILGEFNGRGYIYVPKGTKMAALIRTTGAPPAGQSAVMDCESVDMGGVLLARSIVLNLNITNTVVDRFNGYWGFWTATETVFIRPIGFSMPSLTQVNDACIIACNSTSWAIDMLPTTGPSKAVFTGANRIPVLVPIVKPPALSVSTVPYSNTRVTALSALFTNVTKALNKEGTVLAGRFNPAVQDVFDVTQDSFSQLAPSEKYFFGLEKGFYTYVPPQTDVAEFADDVWDSAHGGTTYAPEWFTSTWIHLGRTALVTAFRFDDPDGGTTLAINVDWHVEYRNSSVLWPVAVSAVSMEQAHQAQLVCLEAGFFFDNVDHRSILSSVTKGLSYVTPVLRATGANVAAVGADKARLLIKSYLKSPAKKAPHIKPTTLNVSRPPPDKKSNNSGKGKKGEGRKGAGGKRKQKS